MEQVEPGVDVGAGLAVLRSVTLPRSGRHCQGVGSRDDLWQAQPDAQPAGAVVADGAKDEAWGLLMMP